MRGGRLLFSMLDNVATVSSENLASSLIRMRNRRRKSRNSTPKLVSVISPVSHLWINSSAGDNRPMLAGSPTTYHLLLKPFKFQAWARLCYAAAWFLHGSRFCDLCLGFFPRSRFFFFAFRCCSFLTRSLLCLRANGLLNLCILGFRLLCRLTRVNRYRNQVSTVLLVT